jgi:hypothetical protein
MNGNPVTSIDELRRLVRKSGKTAAVLVARGDARF